MSCCLLSATAPAPTINPNQRGRPVVTSGPIKTLRTDTGQIIRGGAAITIGANKTSLAFQNSTWAANRALGLNAMRVGVSSNALSLSLSTLLNNIDLVVELARVNRMYIMLGYFVVTPGDWILDVPGNTAAWKTFWSAAAARYKDKEWVFFELVNEPTGAGQVSSYSAAAKEGLKQIYDAARAGAPDTVIAFPGTANIAPTSSQYIPLMQSFDPLGNGVPIDWTRTVLAHHYYNQTLKLAVSGSTANVTDGGEAGLRAMAAVYPLLNTETNWFVEAVRLVLQDGLDLYEKLGIGWFLLRYAGQTEPYKLFDYGYPPLGPDFLNRKIDQLRTRGYDIPSE